MSVKRQLIAATAVGIVLVGFFLAYAHEPLACSDNDDAGAAMARRIADDRLRVKTIGCTDIPWTYADRQCQYVIGDFFVTVRCSGEECSVDSYGIAVWE